MMRHKPKPEVDLRYVRKTLVINKEKDAQVIRKLITVKSANEYILDLIRKDIAQEREHDKGK